MTPTSVLWLAATVAHFAVSAEAVRRLMPGASRDDVLLGSVLGGVAGLSFVLHATALSAGLSFGFGLAALAIWNTFLWAVARRIGARHAVQTPPDVLELTALAVLAALVVAWVGASAVSANLNGPDAAHYHVPFAVNLAHGDSLFALPATPHLYPMAGSLVAAWFILPFNSTLLVDLAMLLPFAVMVSSINVIFRAVTGASGLRWATWLSLGLFSTPLFRSASAGAADLWFAAAFVAVVALVSAAWSRGGWRGIDIVLVGGAVGLLLGSKTTGTPAAGLLALGAAAVWGLQRLLGHPPAAGTRRWQVPLAVGALFALGTGGIWLVRNWALFGSPLAPAGLELFGVSLFDGESHQRTTYFSVLGELQRPDFDLRAVAGQYIRQWLGPAFLPVSGLAALNAFHVLFRFTARKTDPAWWARTGTVLLVTFAGTILIWMLIGAPWTALERSGGLTLRYALPIAALVPVLGYAALFPAGLPWWRHRAAGVVVPAVLMAGSMWALWSSAAEAAPPTALPAIDVVSLVVGAGTVVWLSRAAPPRGLLAVALLATLTVLEGYQLGKADAVERRRAVVDFNTERTAYALGTPQPDIWRTVFLAVTNDESSRAQTCSRRRFFFLTRNDEPMAFQPPSLSSRTYYAGRDVAWAARVGPIGACDYVVTTDALQQTDKGNQLVDALIGGATRETVPAPPPFVVIRPAR